MAAVTESAKAVETAEETAGARKGGRGRRVWGGWPLERALFALAGTLTALSAVLAVLVSPWLLLLAGFVALNQLLFAGLGDCGASLILRHGCGLERAGRR